MTERDPIEQQLMLARAATWAPEAAKARVRANLAASGALSATSTVRAGGVTKLTTVLLVGVSFVAGYWLGFQRSAEPREPARAMNDAERAPDGTAAPAPAHLAAIENPPPGAISTQTDAASATGASMQGEPAAQPTVPRAATPRPLTTQRRHERAAPGRARLARSPAASSDPVAEELLLLSRAERAIRAGEPLLALSFLDELDARFPSSAMLEERAAAHLLADCALSNPGARRRAELFLSDRAASVYTDRVRRSCGLEQPATQATDGSSKHGH